MKAVASVGSIRLTADDISRYQKHVEDEKKEKELEEKIADITKNLYMYGI